MHVFSGTFPISERLVHLSDQIAFQRRPLAGIEQIEFAHERLNPLNSDGLQAIGGDHGGLGQIGLWHAHRKDRHSRQSDGGSAFEHYPPT